VKQILRFAVLVFLFGSVVAVRTPGERCGIACCGCVRVNEGMPPSVPLRIVRDFLIVVEGRFGEQGKRQNFILDTGTAPSIVNARLVTKLGLRPTPSKMSVVGKFIPAQLAVLPELDLGPIHATLLRVQIRDLSKLEEDLGTPIAGIVGLDVLARTSFRLDYEKRLLIFDDVSEDGIRVSVDTRTALAVASVEVDGKPAHMLVDTGSDRVALFANFKNAEVLGLHSTSGKGSSVADTGVDVQVFVKPDILLGEQHFSVGQAYFLMSGEDPAFDGILGVRALGFRAITYNREHGSIYLQK
jgi:Aspartyl protease